MHSKEGNKDNYLHIIKLLIVTVSVAILALLCVSDSISYSDKRYIRCRGMDISLYETDEGAYLFLPSYADESRIKLSNGIKKMNPIMLKSSNLPAIFITTSSGNLDKVYEDKEYKEPGKMYVYDENGRLLISEGLEYIKGRGNYSWSTEEWSKKPFGISTKRDVSILNQPAGRKYALIANASDDTLIRNDLARSIQKTLDVEYASRGDFADLYINGDYMGIYYLCATIDVGENRINIDSSGTDVTGGYLMERELSDRYKLELPTITGGFVTEGEEHFVLSSPSYPTDEQLTYITDYMNRVESVIMSAEGIGPDGNGYEDYIDCDSFVKTYLTEEIIKNYDAGVSSAFYYKDGDKTDLRLHSAPGWDYDMSLGSYQTWMEYDDPTGLTMLYPHEDASPWYKTLYNRNEFREEVISRYRDKKAEIADILYGKREEELREYLKDAYKLEYIRWQDMYDARGSYPGSDEAYDLLTGFARRRIEILDSVW
ncbi:MAG: CotH kinase family protein [Lachnospiraceae bacterium]|nr:CotH kinase family protein [Lachnospiraceae bacterium]